MIDPDDDLADDPQQGRVLEQVVGLVHRPGLGVLERDDAERGLAARHPREHEAHRVARQRLRVGERRPDGSLAVRAGFALVGDLHGRRA
jgi:hypothetical protein